jgi:tetratricopeptide (TPR) repeat protein
MNKELSAEDRDQVRQLVAEILKDEAHLHIGSKRYALAKKRLSQALAQGYDEAKYYADMAYIATELGAPLQSIAHRKKSLSCFKKKNDWLHVVHAHIFLTKNYADLKNKRQARYHAKRAYKLCVDHVVCSKALPLLGNIASALWHVGYKEQCIDVMAGIGC